MNIPSSLLTTLPKPVPAGKMGGDGVAFGSGGINGAAEDGSANFASLLNDQSAATDQTATDGSEAAVQDAGIGSDADMIDPSLLGPEGEALRMTAELSEQIAMGAGQPGNTLGQGGELDPAIIEEPASAETFLDEQQVLNDIAFAELQQPTTDPEGTSANALQMAAALQGAAGAAPGAKSGIPGSTAADPDILNEPPRMFRGAADGGVPQPAQVRETPLPSNNAFARNSNVLELFSSRPASNPVAQAASATTGMAASNGLTNIAPLALNMPNGININNPMVAQSGQVPVLPLSTVYGIPNHVMMQVHPAITERSSPVESSLIAAVPQRGNSSMQLQLVPRSLGVIEMKIVNQNGNISIQIETETVEAQRLLRSETASMLETFRNAGLKLEDFNVNHNSRLEGSSSNERDNRQDGASFNQGRAGNGDQLNNQNSNGSSDNPFDAESYGMVEDTPLANPAETELARDGLYL